MIEPGFASSHLKPARRVPAKLSRIRGDEARDRGDWRTAASFYRIYLEARPSAFPIWVQLGHALKESGDLTGAAQAYETALALDPNESDLLLSLGHLHKLMGGHEAAISFYRRSAAVDGNRDAVEELIHLGLHHGEFVIGEVKLRAPPSRRRWRALLPVWSRFLAWIAGRVRRARARGDAARSRGDWIKASAHYRDHLAITPNDFDIWVQLGHALKEGGRPAEALEAYRRAQMLKPDDGDLLLSLGHFHRQRGELDQAITFYRHSAEAGADPRAVVELERLGQVALDIPPYDRAMHEVAPITLENTALHPALIIIAPLYRSPELIPGLVASLVAVADEIRAHGALVLLINDSPDDAALTAALDAETPSLQAVCDLQRVSNAQNLGFVGAANRGLRLALDLGADALLLNSDALLTPGSLTELVAVAQLDPLTSAVSPRSNNATLCNSPYPERFRDLDYDGAVAAHCAVSHYIHRVTYTPTAVGFCLLIRHLMLAEFGLFDPIYGGGYNEENDFLMRCNRHGYRAVLANRAFAYHIGSVSFGHQGKRERDQKNHAILAHRYPEYDRAVQRYFSGVDYKAQVLAAGLIPTESGKRRILFDGRNIGPYHNGTFEHTKRLIAAFAQQYVDEYECHLCCSHAAYEFHQFKNTPGLAYCWNAERTMAPFAVALRIAQPFQFGDLTGLAALAPITGFLMLDTIALDCQALDDQGLEGLWRQMLETSGLVGFNSHFTARQFRSRFPLPPQLVDFVSLCSTDVADYTPTRRAWSSGNPQGYILLVGNHFAHKHVRETLAVLTARAERPPVVVLGLSLPDQPGVTSYRSGELPQAQVDALYDEAGVVLFPSCYEGFGLPIMHALAHGKPVIARDLPVFEEIRRRTPLGANIHLASTTEALVGQACNPPPWRPAASNLEPTQTWAMASQAMGQAVGRCLSQFDYAALTSRLQRLEGRRS